MRTKEILTGSVLVGTVLLGQTGVAGACDIPRASMKAECVVDGKNGFDRGSITVEGEQTDSLTVDATRNSDGSYLTSFDVPAGTTKTVEVTIDETVPAPGGEVKLVPHITGTNTYGNSLVVTYNAVGDCMPIEQVPPVTVGTPQMPETPPNTYTVPPTEVTAAAPVAPTNGPAFTG